MTTQNATVFIVDDDAAIRKSLEMLLKSVGHASESYRSAQEFLDAYEPSRPGCLILDIRMPGMSGLELQRTLRERGHEIPVIIITGHGDVPVAVRSLKEGALEFLEKPFSKQMLLEHVREALQRDAASRSLRGSHQARTSKLALLTPREQEVLELVVAGKVSKEIAAQLGLSKKTVDVHRTHIMQKLQVETLADLVQLVMRTRLPAEARDVPGPIVREQHEHWPAQPHV
jgi:two-component system, LuxR family, response regulator FixJ